MCIADFIKQEKDGAIALSILWIWTHSREVGCEHESLNQRAYYLNDGLLYADLPLSGKPLLDNIVIIENVLYD